MPKVLGVVRLSVVTLLAIGLMGLSPAGAATDAAIGSDASDSSGVGPASWGSNTYGELGNGSPADSSVPVAVNTTGVLAGKTVTALSAGRHSCAVADGRAFCWGYNGAGALGNQSYSDSSVPVAVNTAGVLAGKTVTSVAVGTWHTCAIADGQAYCWGSDASGQLGTKDYTNSSVPVAVDTTGVLSDKSVTSIAAGTTHSCAIADGQAYCWGSNANGQLGNSSFTDSSVPVAVNTAGVLSGKDVNAIAAGARHSCASAQGQSYCWGWNNEGQLGNGTTTDSSVPVAVESLGVLSGLSVTAIATGSQHTCAVAGGKAFCWGLGSRGQLGNGLTASSSVPVGVVTGGVLAEGAVITISAGELQSLAVVGHEVVYSVSG